ncbi:hypothetical protein SDC9_126720 [bioreactor metagenome]|uniref:Uncharacterized protein n=1 Tax=bioreactor metagenome TaxID=1076179 RepID=A0A645CRZ4_9ZZZZ
MAKEGVEQATESMARFDDASVGRVAAAPMEVIVDDGKQAAGCGRIGRDEQAVAFVAPGGDACLCRRGVLVEQVAGFVVQPFGTQPRRTGQIVPIEMQAAERQPLVMGILDLDQIAAFVAMAADMQGLVDVGNQMQQPGQGVGHLLGGTTGFQLPDQLLDPGIQFALADLAVGIEVDVMPALVAGRVGQAGQQRCRRIALLVMEARVVADVVRPG